MKKTVSIILAIVVTLSMFSCLGVATSAYGNVESFSYEPAEPIKIIENERLWLETEDVWNEEFSKFESVPWYVYDYEYDVLPKLGDTITVNYTDGSSEVLTFSQGDDYYEWTKSSGATVEIDLFLSDDQEYENQWGLGSHNATVHCFGKEATIQVTIVESPVESVSFVCDSPIEVIENVDGISQSDYFDYDYDMALREKDKLIKVVYKDGTEKEFAYQGRFEIKAGGAGLTRYSARFRDVESGEEAYGYIYDLQDIESWELGTNYITVSYLGVSVQVPVTVVEEVEPEAGLFLDEEYTVSSGTTKIFIPEESGYYRFTSNGYGDPKITITCLGGEYSFDNNSDFDFDGTVYLEKGEEVSCYLYNYSGSDCVFTITGPTYDGPDNGGTSVTEGLVSLTFSPADKIVLNKGEDAVNEYCYEYWENGGCDLCDGEYEYYSYVSDLIWSGTFTALYSDGTVLYYEGNGQGGFVAQNGNQFWDESLTFSDNQAYNHWIEPGEYSFSIGYCGFTATVPVTIVEGSGDEPEADLFLNEEYTVASGTYRTFIPEESGYYRFVSNGYGDPKIKITCLGGEYSFDDNNVMDFDGTVYLEAGEIVTCYLYNYEGSDCIFTITKEDEPDEVVSELVVNEEYTVSSGTTKIFIPEESGYYRFTSNGYGDPKITITCLGGEYSFDDNSDFDFDGTVYLEAGETVSCYLYNYEGSDCIFTITKEDNEDFGDDDDEEVEKSIVSCSFSLAEPIVLYKGYKISDEGYFIDCYEDGNIFTIHYSDGSTTEYIFGYNEDYGYSGWFNESGESLNGYIDATTPGSENWDVGEHTVTLKYEDYEYDDKYEMEIEVSVIENPVESISVNLSEAIEFTEGEDSSFWTDSKGNLYNYYNPNKWDIPYGSTLTVNYKDGSEENYTLNKVMDMYDKQYYPTFQTADGKILKDYDWNVDSDEEINRWYLGENYLTLSVYGVFVQLPVLVKENNVESFSIDYGSEIVYKQGTNCWAENDYIDKGSDTYSVEYDMYKYWLGENGWELTVNYKDGTSDVFVCTVYEDYETGSSTQWYNASGECVEVAWSSDQSYDNHWGIGTHYVTVGCLGKTMQIPIKIIANDDCSHTYENGFCTVCKEEDPSYSIPTLGVGESKTVTISNSGKSNYFYFTPARSGVYSFSVPYAGEYGANYDAVIYGRNFTVMKSRVRWSSECKEIYNYFEAGEKYIIKCNYGSSSETGSFEISCNFDFYTGEGTNIVENYMFIPCFKTAVADFVTVSDEIEFNCTASFVTATSNYFGTGSQFSYSIGGNTPGYTIIVEGDLNGDSVCDVLDAAVAQLYSAGFYEPTKNETYAANGDLIDEFDVNSYQNVVNCVLSS